MSYKEIWDKRYSDGENSGRGSYGEHYEFKTNIINDILEKYNIKDVIDFGCGDGNMLRELEIGTYKGLDLSHVSIEICQKMYEEDSSKSFELYEIGKRPSIKAKMTMSLDVIYHIIDDAYFNDYMNCLIECTDEYILIYSTNYDDSDWNGHVRHREFEKYLKDQFERIEFIKNTLDCPADFYLYQKKIKK